VSKFVGKFRKNKDYKDDYVYAKSFLQTKKRRNEQAEVKRIKSKEYDEILNSYEDSYFNK
jgi:hypothetical protein